MNYASCVVNVAVFVVNVFGWIFLFGMNLMSCDPSACSGEVIVLILVQCAETVFLAFELATCFKSEWSVMDWISWAVALLVVTVSGLLETWIFWQEHAANNATFALTLGVHVEIAPMLAYHSYDVLSWFISLSCLMPLFLLFYLVFLAVQKSQHCPNHHHHHHLSLSTHTSRTAARI